MQLSAGNDTPARRYIKGESRRGEYHSVTDMHSVKLRYLHIVTSNEKIKQYLCSINCYPSAKADAPTTPQTKDAGHKESEDGRKSRLDGNRPGCDPEPKPSTSTGACRELNFDVRDFDEWDNTAPLVVELDESRDGFSGGGVKGNTEKSRNDDSGEHGVGDGNELRHEDGRDVCGWQRNGGGGDEWYTKRHANGKERRYSFGGGSCERLIGKDGSTVPTAPGIGTYHAANEKNYKRIYNGPWKLAVVHHGTQRLHWHFVYVSTSNQWGHSSRLGRTIRDEPYKCESITCLACLRVYLYSGNGREVLQDTLVPKDFEGCCCVAHSLGMEVPIEQTGKDCMYASTSWRDGILYTKSGTSSVGHVRLDSSTSETDASVHSAGRDNVEHQSYELSHRREPQTTPRYGRNVARTNRHFNIGNAELVLLLCKNRAFNEGEATRVLSKTPEGIDFMFKPRANDRIKTAVSLSRVLVFQETLRQRFNSQKEYERRIDPTIAEEDNIHRILLHMIGFLKDNGINILEFSRCTYLHLTQQLGKKNNLFFYGAPSTGKTMIMETLQALHYNTTRLTGLTPNSSFNFMSLLHTNACFMDECKLTDNQFEQWKLLAGGAAMSTDVKYKDKHDVINCVLYTCSNYPIEMFCQVPDAAEAIRTRTVQFTFSRPIESHFKMNAITWEKFWYDNGGYEI